MAKYTRKRVEHFLKLPVTLVTDDESMPVGELSEWDKVIKITPDKDNFRDWGMWITKADIKHMNLVPMTKHFCLTLTMW